MMRKTVALDAVAGAVIGAAAVASDGPAAVSSTTSLRLSGGLILKIPPPGGFTGAPTRYTW
ncbi:hypothetical protein [Microbispora sp. ATCC PTA-5024]|uniref:hypothetical protein n=1 Tax=Microbispora sp. ATCC PTA-5024 TaxID=316330 RepID=UPI000419EE82|nr:hypothetical protein [Microbispora sp. ATCC PTA-5024]